MVNVQFSVTIVSAHWKESALAVQSAMNWELYDAGIGNLSCASVIVCLRKMCGTVRGEGTACDEQEKERRE